MKNDEDLQKILKLKSISTSQLSRKLRDTPAQVLQVILKDLKVRILAEKGARKTESKLVKYH